MADQAQGAPAPDAKVFTLKPSEGGLLEMIQRNNQAVMSAVISYIAKERLGYEVTNKTQFVIDQSYKEIRISELAEVPVNHPSGEGVAPAAPAPAEADKTAEPTKPEAEGDSPIATAH